MFHDASYVEWLMQNHPEDLPPKLQGDYDYDDVDNFDFLYDN